MELSASTRLDKLDQKSRARLERVCRLQPGDFWIDPLRGHKVGCGDCTDSQFIAQLMGEDRASLMVHDPPYNLVAFGKRTVDDFIDFCKNWIDLSWEYMDDNAALYVWLGADQKNHFQPLPQFMAMMADTEFESRSFITMRNQRGYGTQKNWMAVRQELLYYTKGDPSFAVQYTDIPKILRGYYKTVNGQRTENLQRSKSDMIRPGNVWVDVQQVFYRMKENVDGCFAQKPQKAIERIIAASSTQEDIVADFFSHSGTTLAASEALGRRCITCDIDPIFCELTIQRLEQSRTN
jgi:site-specific DNA-methyltransferase (adenine-specific)